MPWFVTTSRRGSSPRIVAWPVVAFVPAEVDPKPLTVPSVHGEYKFPSAAQEGYHVSADVYSACLPVNPMPVKLDEAGKGQSDGGVDGHTRYSFAFGASTWRSAECSGGMRPAMHPRAATSSVVFMRARSKSVFI
jgi:hypothetical protein